MADAIANLSITTGQPPLLYSLCEWGWVRLASSHTTISVTANVRIVLVEPSLALGCEHGEQLACTFADAHRAHGCTAHV